MKIKMVSDKTKQQKRKNILLFVSLFVICSFAAYTDQNSIITGVDVVEAASLDEDTLETLAETAWITTRHQVHENEEEDVTDPEDAIALFFSDEGMLFIGTDQISGYYTFDGKTFQTDKDIYGEVEGDTMKLYLPDGLYRILVRTDIIDAVEYLLWLEE